MNQRTLVAALTILLSLAPLASADPRQAQPGAARPAAGARATPAYTLIDRLKSAGTNPSALRALAAETGAAADFVRAALADPSLLSDPALRTRAEAALGPSAVLDLEAAALYWSAAASRDASAAEALAAAAGGATGEKARRALAAIARDVTAAWASAESDSVAAPSGPSARTQTLSRPAARGVRATMAALAAVAAIGAASPAVSAPALSRAVMTPATQAQAVRVSQIAGAVAAADVAEAGRKFDPNAQVYLISNPDFPESSARRLMAELKGKPVVVVIVGDSTVNTYKSHRGAEAVDWWVGEDLYARGGVTDAKNAVTGDRAGIIITVIQKARQDAQGQWRGRVLIRASDALKNQGLLVSKRVKADDRVWTADYDKVFIEKYRVGNDIVGAVAATVAALDRDLGDRLKAAQAHGTNAVAAARAQVELLSKAKADLASKHPKAAATIGAAADLGAMQRALADAETLAKQGRSAAAAAAAAGIPAAAQRAVSEIDEYMAGPDKLAEAAKRLEAVGGMESASAASTLLTEAGQDLRAASEAHADAKPQWSAKLASAKGKIDAAEKIVVEAQKTAGRDLMIRLGLLLGLLLTGGLAGVYMNRRFARPLRDTVLETLAPWDKKFAAMDNAVIDNVDKWLMDNLARGWQGRTLEKVKEMQMEAGAADIRSKAMMAAYAKVASLVRPPLYMIHRRLFNAVWPAKLLGISSNYAKAQDLMTTTPIEVTLEERKADWKDTYYGPIGNFKPIKKTFPELVESHNKHAAAAVAAREALEQARSRAAALAGEIAAAMAGAETLKVSLRNADGLFQVAALFETALPRANELARSVMQLKDFDPVGALEKGGAEAARIASESQALGRAISHARSGALVRADAAAKALEAGGFKTAWVDAAARSLSADADAIAAGITQNGMADRIAALSEGFDMLARAAEDVAAGAAALVEGGRRIDEVAATIAPARAKISAATGIAADALLKEADANPDEAIAQARAAASRGLALIDGGELERARAAYSEMRNAADAAAGLVATALQALESFQSTSKALEAETARIEGLVAPAKAVLDAMRQAYAPSALRLNAGDKTHPNANGTVEDNVDEIEAALKAASDKKSSAVSAFKKGQIIKAWQIVQQIETHQKIALDRIDEIHGKVARLESQSAANASAVKALEARVAEFQISVAADDRSQAATLKSLDAAKKQASKAAKASAAKKGDPFQAGEFLAAAAKALDDVWSMRQHDMQLHARAIKAVEDAFQALDEAGTLFQKLKAEQGRTSLLREAEDTLAGLGASYEDAAGKLAVDRATGRMLIPHGDWQEVAKAAARVSVESARVAALLKDELRNADEAANAVAAATAQIDDAARWRDMSFGVTVAGTPGAAQTLDDASAALEDARRALRSGRYDQAKRHSQSAVDLAAEALRLAQAEAGRLLALQQQAEQQAREQRRRREQAEAEARRRSSEGDPYGRDGDYGRRKPNEDGPVSGNDGSDIGSPKNRSTSGNAGSDL